MSEEIKQKKRGRPKKSENNITSNKKVSKLENNIEANIKSGSSSKKASKKQINVSKRDGRIVAFESNKVMDAIKSAFISDTGSYDEEIIIQLTAKVVKDINKFIKDDNLEVISVEQIQDIVENVLIKSKYPNIAKEYIRYRAKRTQIRDANNDLMKLYNDIYFAPAKDMELKRDNANINGDTSMGVMLKCGSEGNKYFLLNHFLKPEYANAHKEGWLHLHDLDFSIITMNCLQVDLDKLFHNGFNTGHGFIREPNSIRSYAALACIAIQSSQNEMFGGQSINAFDFYMAPGVRKSFAKAFKHNLTIAEDIIIKEENVFDKVLEQDYNSLPKYKDQESFDTYVDNFIDNFDDEDISAKSLKRAFKFAYKQAHKDIEEETKQAMEAVIHNFNTLQSRAGSQTPFSSVNFGTDTSHEGRLVIKELIESIYRGLGKGETSIFPEQLGAFKNENLVNLI